MDTGLRRKASIIASLVLVGLTVFVFAGQQNRGPVSLIRRFHAGVERDDPRVVQPLCLQRLDAPGPTRLVLLVYAILKRDADYRIVRVLPGRDEVLVDVQYRSKEGGTRTIVWVVRPVQGGWAVDADATIDKLPQSLKLW